MNKLGNERKITLELFLLKFILLIKVVNVLMEFRLRYNKLLHLPNVIFEKMFLA